MRLLQYLEIENFKRFGDRQRIELEHPTVIIGPNNCGKTTAIQAIALWSQALKTWFDVRKDSSASERTATALNRLNIVSVPVQRTRYYWHNTSVRLQNKDIPLLITVGVSYENRVEPVTMRFRNQGDELIYCSPDDEALKRMDVLKHAASINVELLYPMSGLETEEPILQPGRIGVLLGQGQTAQVLRNLCLLVAQDSPEDWKRIVELMNRLFSVELGYPQETTRGAIELHYKQTAVKEQLDVAMAGRGFQQMLLIFSYLYSHRRSVLLVDEPDAHLELLRQKQVYVLLRDIASANASQVVIVTHSEVILEEALDTNLTLLVEGKADDLAAKKDIRAALKHFGAEHYIRAQERGYVLYVEGGTDIDMLRALARHLQHPVADIWDERINSFYVKDNYPLKSLESELKRVEGGFGITPKHHFRALKGIVPGLQGLAILDNDGRNRQDGEEDGLKIVHWRRYEAENYFIVPDVLRRYALERFVDIELFDGFSTQIEEVLNQTLLVRVFEGDAGDLEIWRTSPPNAARLIWETKTERIKLSDVAEEFFRGLSNALGSPMLLRKGELHQLVPLCDQALVPQEVVEKLDLLYALFKRAHSHQETTED
ncbi:MAG: ATP-binding protein [Candidatus Hydrogenedentes bacterium]|nr:ATP-binding protein [Candidatus Hydrogenedentota bacterium]